MQIGDRIIAKNSHKKCGYKRGDTILIKRESIFKGDFVGENLTRPDAYGNEQVYMSDYMRYKTSFSDKEETSVFELNIFNKWRITVKKIT